MVQVLPEPWQVHPIFLPREALTWTLWPVHPFFNPANVRRVLGATPNVLILPDPVISPAMAWQIESGMGFTQSGGYVGFTLVGEQKWNGLEAFSWGRLMPQFSTFFPAYCAAHRVDYILMAPATPSNVVDAIEGLGWPHHVEDGIEIVAVPGGQGR
jgi:hypothetical protein